MLHTETTLETQTIKYEEKYYQMIDNNFKVTKRVCTKTVSTIKTRIIEVYDIDELSLLLEAQNRNELDVQLFELNTKRNLLHASIVK